MFASISIFALKYPLPTIAALILILYSGSLTYGLVYCDDYEIIVRGFAGVPKLDDFIPQFFSGYITSDYYRPMINVSFLINALIGYHDPFTYHLFNVILHILCVFYLFKLLILLEYNRKTSYIAVLIFAVHPLLVNSISWIAGRNDTILSLFAILSFIYLIKYYNSRKVVFLILNSAFHLLAALSKETGLLLPFAFIAYIIFLKREAIISRQNLKLIASWCLGFAAWFVFRSLSDLGEEFYLTGYQVIMKNLAIIPEYLAKFYLPFNLSTLAVYNQSLIAAGIFLMLILLLFIIGIKNRKMLFFGIIWFLLFTAPAMLMTFTFRNDWNDYLECRAYLPMIGLLLISIEIIKRIKINARLTTAIAILIIVVFSILNIIEQYNYKDQYTFFASATEDAPHISMFHDRVGLALLNKEDTKGARKKFAEAIRLNPWYWKLYYHMGSAYLYENRFFQAGNYLDKSIRLNYEINKSGNLYSESITVLLKKGRVREALNLLDKLNPSAFTRFDRMTYRRVYTKP